MKRWILIIIVLLFVTGCSNETHEDIVNDKTNTAECLIGEVDMGSECCRYSHSSTYNYNEPCPSGYDDVPPSGYNRNACWKETCRRK